MSQCKEPHPDNGNPGATYFDRHGGSHESHGAGIFCEREKGHEGRHTFTRNWADGVMGEQQQWGGDLGPNSWAAIPFIRSAKDRADELRRRADEIESQGSATTGQITVTF